jgi:transaldolase
MGSTNEVHKSGPGFWLNHITRDWLKNRNLQLSIAEWLVTGLSFNTSAVKPAIENTKMYDSSILRSLLENKFGEELLLQLAIEDIRLATDLLRAAFDKSGGLDGWASIDVSPLLLHDAESCVSAAKSFYDRVFRANIFIGIPGTPEGLAAVEEAIFMGVPVNVTLLFSREQYLAAASAFMSGIERRIAAGLKADVSSVASVTINPWNSAVAGKAPAEIRGRVGIAVAQNIYEAYRKLLASPRWKHISNCRARPQRILWDRHPIKALKPGNTLPPPLTIRPLSENTLQTLAQPEEDDTVDRPGKGCDASVILEQLDRVGVDIHALADQLQAESVAAEIKAYIDLLGVIADKSATLTKIDSDRSAVSARMSTEPNEDIR